MTDLAKGQLVTVRNPIQPSNPLGYLTFNLPAGAEGEVMRVNAGTAYVSFPRRFAVGLDSYSKAKRYTAVVALTDLIPGAMTAKAVEEKKKRKLGQKPEGDQFIGPDHPGIQWLWEDVAKVAERQSYCGYYDQIASSVGIPGRKRDIRVSHKVDGLTFEVIVKARSQKEADQIVADKLAKAAQKDTVQA